MKHTRMLLGLLALFSAATPPASASPRPSCEPQFYTLPSGQRLTLPMCAEAAPASASYPCTSGDIVCYCRWRGTTGQFADNDPSVGCRNFYWCYAKGVGVYHRCQEGLIFNQRARVCDLPENTECSSGSNGTASALPPPPPAPRRPPPRPPARRPPSPRPPPPFKNPTGCASGDAACFCRKAGALGMFADEAKGCQAYYWCVATGQSYYKQCGPGLIFDNIRKACDWPAGVKCGKSPPPPPPSPPLPPAPPGGRSIVDRYLTADLWSKFFVLGVNSPACPAYKFYTYQSFIEAAKAFPRFASSADDVTNKRELAAFLAQISHETTGAPDGGPYEWGLCFKEELCAPNCNPTTYCNTWSDLGKQFPCEGRSYNGRGPMQLSWNINYGLCGRDLGLPLLTNPDLVSSDPVTAFKTALWFWSTPKPYSNGTVPSCHDVITGRWTPDGSGRVPGFGMTTLIINGNQECFKPPGSSVRSRIGYFRRYTQLLAVDPGDSLDCTTQPPYPW